VGSCRNKPACRTPDEDAFVAEPCIGLAVPGRPIGPWPRRTGAPEASATRTGACRYTRSRQVEECNGNEWSPREQRNRRSSHQRSRQQAPFQEAGQSSSLPPPPTGPGHRPGSLPCQRRPAERRSTLGTRQFRRVAGRPGSRRPAQTRITAAAPGAARRSWSHPTPACRPIV
jgi:hypothetical protein